MQEQIASGLLSETALDAALSAGGGAGYPATNWSNEARPKQLPPEGNWRIWLLLSGRGFGKTRSITEWANECARLNPGSRGALVGATAADVRDVLVEGESGLMNIAIGGFRPIYEPSKRRVTWPNGTTAITFSADEPNRFRGPQFHWAICDELAAWRYPSETLDMLLMGLRLGDDPRCAIATTPRPLPIIIRLLDDPTVSVTKGSTYENRDNLAPAFFNQIISRYEGTRLGRQEIEAEILSDVIGALWNRALLEECRVNKTPDLMRVVVSIDPAVTVTEDSSETGMIVSAVGADGHGYVLEDLTLSATPAVWANQAIAAYYKYKADRIIAEVNNGGDMIEHTIRTIDPLVSFKQVRATRGKFTRAEPVAALYEQRRVHHVGMFGALEDQMCQWVVGEKSPDRLDALVWSLTELMLEDEKITVDTAFDILSSWRG